MADLSAFGLIGGVPALLVPDQPHAVIANPDAYEPVTGRLIQRCVGLWRSLGWLNYFGQSQTVSQITMPSALMRGIDLKEQATGAMMTRGGTYEGGSPPKLYLGRLTGEKGRSIWIGRWTTGADEKPAAMVAVEAARAREAVAATLFAVLFMSIPLLR